MTDYIFQQTISFSLTEFQHYLFRLHHKYFSDENKLDCLNTKKFKVTPFMFAKKLHLLF